VSLLRLKALTPQSKIDRPAGQMLLRWLEARLTALPPQTSDAPLGDGPPKH